MVDSLNRSGGNPNKRGHLDRKMLAPASVLKWLYRAVRAKECCDVGNTCEIAGGAC